MIAALRTPFTYLVGLSATGLAAIAVIIISLLAPTSPLINRIVRGWARIVLWSGGVRLKVIGVEHVDPSTSYVVVSNHQSTFDIMAHFLALPIPIRFLAKKELFGVPLLGWALRRLNMVPVDRFAGRTVYNEIENRRGDNHRSWQLDHRLPRRNPHHHRRSAPLQERSVLHRRPYRPSLASDHHRGFLRSLATEGQDHQGRPDYRHHWHPDPYAKPDCGRCPATARQDSNRDPRDSDGVAITRG